MTNLEKEINSLLAAGKTPEDIAAQFSEALNAADKKATLKSEKIAETQTLLNSIHDYLKKYYPEAEVSFSDETTATEAEAAIALLDRLLTPPSEEEVEKFHNLFTSPLTKLFF